MGPAVSDLRLQPSDTSADQPLMPRAEERIASLLFSQRSERYNTVSARCSFHVRREVV